MVVPIFMFLLPRVPARPGLRRAFAPALAVAVAGLVYLPLLTVGWFYLR